MLGCCCGCVLLRVFDLWVVGCRLRQCSLLDCLPIGLLLCDSCFDFVALWFVVN